MIKHKQNFTIEQVNKKLLAFDNLRNTPRPTEGWVHAIRNGMKMSMRQLGKRLDVTPQSVKELETREKVGTVTLDALEKAGKALNMKLVYGFVPEGSIDEMIADQARRVATMIVMRTSKSQNPEGTETSTERIEREIEELTEELKRTMPRYLWD